MREGQKDVFVCVLQRLKRGIISINRKGTMGDYAGLAPTRAQKEFNTTTTSNTIIGSSRGDIIEKQGSSTSN